MGRVEFKLDRTAIIHVTLGKASFEESALMENLTSLMEAVVRAKPAGAKGQYIKSVCLTTTMGPGFMLDLRRQWLWPALNRGFALKNGPW